MAALHFHLSAACAVLSDIAQTGDGALLGLGAAYVAVRSIIKFASTSAALGKIRDAPFVQVADLRSDGSDGEHLMFVRGTVEPKFVAESNPVFRFLLRTLIPHTLVPHSIVAELSKRKAVIYHRTKRFVNKGWTSPLRSAEYEFSSSWQVPFVLTPGMPLRRDYIIVNMFESNHPLPLVRVHSELHHVPSSKYNLLHALFAHQNPVAMLDQESILTLWNDITALGYVSWKDGITEIKSCKDLPYFLSRMSKVEMIERLNTRAKVLLWSSIIFGSFAIGLLGYAAVRNWSRLKEWWQHRRPPE